MKEAIIMGLNALEEKGYLKWNEHYVGSEQAWSYIAAEIEKLTFREMEDFLKNKY